MEKDSRENSCIPDVDGLVKGTRYDLISIVVVMQRNNFRRVASQRAQLLTCRIQIAPLTIKAEYGTSSWETFRTPRRRCVLFDRPAITKSHI